LRNPILGFFNHSSAFSGCQDLLSFDDFYRSSAPL
jgi:hypothetical protein